ncbi:MAG: transporter permease [Anaerocolumna sp.]|jgi:NitT/TauT family transport system permease protein|nr:transporter permease [Anaerocolumna sp.]
MKKWFGVISLILCWQLIAVLAHNKIFPTFIEVMIATVINLKSIMIHTYFSTIRLIAGVILSIVIGMPAGILVGYHKRLSEYFSPIIYLLAPIPKIALLPLIMLLFGIGDMSKIFIIFIIMFFQVVVAAHDAVKNIPSDYFIPLKTIKSKHKDILIHIIFPAALPEMFTSVRIGLATGISVLFFAETFGTKWGLGFYIMDMWMRLDYKQMYSGILFLGILGLISVIIVNQLQKYICPWIQNNKN